MPKKQDQKRELTRAERKQVQAVASGAVAPEAAAAQISQAQARKTFWR